MNVDPYAPPASFAEEAAPRPALRQVLRAWEKLRLPYNAVLLVPGLYIFWFAISKAYLPVKDALLSAFGVAAGANLCFLLGPLAEWYWCRIFAGREPAGRGRSLLFALGLVVSGGLFVLAYLSLCDAQGLHFTLPE